MSRLDAIYRKFLTGTFFNKGWGNPDLLKKLFECRKIVTNREECLKLVARDHPIFIDKEETHSDYILIDGHFLSPFAQNFPETVPEESHNAYFQLVLPREWKTRHRPICIHLAGTGDHFFWRRRTLLAKPLAREANIASIILENPFYGVRKPKTQNRSCLHNVSDIFVMGGSLALESIALLQWCERMGYGPLGMSGISMGGHMASIAACSWPKPIAFVPCLSWTTASCVFTQGVMSDCLPWHLLQDQYFSNCAYRDEIAHLITSMNNESHAYEAGQYFVRSYPSNAATTGITETDGNANLITSGGSEKQSVGLLAVLSTADGLRKLQSYMSSLTRNNVKSNSLEALHFMRGIMDEFTHLEHFSMPVDPSLVIIVAAKNDAYVLRDGIMDLTELWKGSEVRYLDTGHISAFIFKQATFRQAIVDSFKRLTDKYYTEDKMAQ